MERLGRLSTRALNRATLARQFLLWREPVGAVEAVERLAGLQAQYSPSPYVALWSRLEGFRMEALQAAIEQREVVKATLMRGTLHLIVAREFPAYLAAPSTERSRAERPSFGRAGGRSATDQPEPVILSSHHSAR